MDTTKLIPEYAINLEAWAKQASDRAHEYLGMPESTIFLEEARRYMTVNVQLKNLKAELDALKDKLKEAR